MRLTQGQTLIVVLALLIAAVVLFVLGFDVPGGICLGYMGGLLTPTEAGAPVQPHAPLTAPAPPS